MEGRDCSSVSTNLLSTVLRCRIVQADAVLEEGLQLRSLLRSQLVQVASDLQNSNIFGNIGAHTTQNHTTTLLYSMFAQK